MAGSLLPRFKAFVEANPGPHLCACGCGGLIVLQIHHMRYGIPRFIRDHQQRRASKRKPLAERFWMKVKKGESCWLWTGSTANGYGRIRSDDGGGGKRHARTLSAHRLSWEMHCGPIPDGMQVLHNCPGGDNPRCVNPAHLWLGTLAENMADKIAKGGQPLGEKCGTAKLTNDAVREIKRRLAAGEMQKTLASEFGVNHCTISSIHHGRYWRHILTPAPAVADDAASPPEEHR